MSAFMGSGSQERVLNEQSIAAAGDARYLVIKPNTAGVTQAPPSSADQSAARNTIGAAGLLRTFTKLLSGSGTYQTPVGCKMLKIRLVGAGGGGGGSGGLGGTGGATTFGSSLLVANGGSGGATYGGGAAAGATASGGDYNGIGNSAPPTSGAGGASGTAYQGINGAPSVLGGHGLGGNVGAPGSSAPANSGGGGGGGGSSAGGNGGGNSGASLLKLISNPATSYAYTVGAGGTAGTAGQGQPGGTGGSGFILIEEFY